MSVKLFKRSSIIYNLILFLIGSFFYYYVLLSLDAGESFYSKKRFLVYLSDNVSTVVLLFFTMIAIFKVHSLSKFLLFIFLLVMAYYNLSVFFYKFDKVVLILILLYILIAFYFFLLWAIELKDVVYCPGFSIRHCGKKTVYNLKVEVENPNGLIYQGYLTNWDNNGSFFIIDEKDVFLSGKITIRINFEGQFFSQKGNIVTKYANGHGVKFEAEVGAENKHWGWDDFYTIIRHRGYKPLI